MKVAPNRMHDTVRFQPFERTDGETLGDQRETNAVIRIDTHGVDHSAKPIVNLAFGLPSRIILVDDSTVFLDALERLVASLPGAVVVGVATSGAEALEQAARIHPDLVLTDFSMPWMNGLEVARCLLARPRPPRIILMTADHEAAYLGASAEVGAEVCLAKSELSVTLEPWLKRLFPHGGTAEDVGMGPPRENC